MSRLLAVAAMVIIVSTSPIAAQTCGGPAPLPINAPSNACAGSAQRAGVMPSYSGYSWSATNATLEGPLNKETVTFRPDGTGPVTIHGQATNFQGCPVAGQVTIPLGAIPVPVINVSIDSICPVGYSSAYVPDLWGTYTWTITNAMNVSGLGTNGVQFDHAPGGGDVEITLQVGEGSCAATANKTIPLRPALAPSASLAAPSVCPGGTGTLYIDNWDNFSTINVYANGGNITNIGAGRVSGGRTVTFQPFPSSTQVQLSIQDDYNSCNTPVDITVPIVAAPQITLATPDVCPYGSDTASVPAGFANYWWSVSGGYISSGDGTNSITFHPGSGMPGNPGPVTLTLFVQDANGCLAPQATATVPIRTIPAPQITVATPDVCPNGTDTATVPAQYANYWWSITGGSITSGDGTNTITFRPGGGMPGSMSPVTITLFVQDANGCTAPQATVTVPIRTIPAPQISVATPDVCPNGNDTATVPAQYANYWWLVNGGSITGGDGTNTITFRPGSGMPGSTGPVTITLFVQDANGCTAPQATVTVPIRTIEPPQISVTTADVCSMGSDSATVPAGFANYWWTVTNGNITGGLNTRTITFTPLNATDPVTVSVIVQDANGCSANSASVTVPIRALAPPVVTASGSTSLCANGSVTLTAPAGFSYLWSNGAATRSITVSQPNDYVVRVSDTNGCSASSAPAHVSAATPATPNISASFASICPNGFSILTVTNASAFASITWTASNGSVYPYGSDNSQVTVQMYYYVSGDVTATMHATDIVTGCPVVASITLPDVRPTPPPITITGTGCSNARVTASIPAQPPGTSINWWALDGAEIISGGNGTTSAVIYTTGSDFRVKVETASPQSCVVDNVVTVPIHRVPDPVLTADDTNGYGCAFSEKTITLTNGSVYTSIAWSVLDGTIAGPSDQPSVRVRLNDDGSSAEVSVIVSDNGTCFSGGYKVIRAMGPTAVIYGGYCAGSPASTLGVSTSAGANATYLWSNGATSSTVSVPPGTYTVTVTSSIGCSRTSEPFTVDQVVEPVQVSGPTTFCAGGSVTLTAADDPSNTFAWSNGATTRSITVTQSGDYSVTVTGLLICRSISNPIHVTVNALSTPAVSANGPTTFCPGGSVVLTASSGTSYSWSNGASTQSITVNTSGSYIVTVTDANGCSAASAATAVTVNPNPTAAITAGGPVTFCAGGSVTLTASSASSYLWSTGAATQSITVNAAGSYSVTVTNANGCSATSVPAPVTVNANPTASITTGGPTTFCAGGSVTLTASAASSYAWPTGATTQSIVVNTSGNYSVTVTNASGCSVSSAPTAVTVNANPAATITASGPATLCAGGSVTLTASSGSSYLWSNGTTTPSIIVSAAGNYSVTVTNAAGCQTTSTPIAVTSSTLSVTTSASATTICDGQAAFLTAHATGGTAPYSYQWSNGAGVIAGATAPSYTATVFQGYYVTVTDSLGCTVSSVQQPLIINVNPTPAGVIYYSPDYFCSGAAKTITGLPMPGMTYAWTVTNGTLQSTAGSNAVIVAGTSGSVTIGLTVTNSSGCSWTGTASVPIIAAPSIPVITPSGPTTFCPGGSVILSVPDGYTYAWQRDSTPAGTGQSIGVTTAGSYTVTVTNASGCSRTSSPTVVTVNASPAAVIAAGGPTTFCAGGSLTMTASSGSSYLWSNGPTTQVISATTSGNYSVTVTDANGCSATSAPLPVTVNPNPAATLAASGPITFCAGGSVTLTASSGSSYFWSNGGRTQSITASTSGSYSVIVNQATGCSSTSAATTVTVNANPTATIAAGGPATFCAGGSVTLTASSGSSYLWSNGATTQSISANSSDGYSVTVTNANGCSATSATTSVTVNAIPTASITAGGSTTFCAGGSVTLTASSGSSYLWSNGATTQSISANTSGSYSVAVTNANGCSATSAATTVNVNASPTASITPPGGGSFCEGGGLTLTASSGSSYLWSNGATTQSITVYAGGSYSVTVTNASGCSATSSPTMLTVNPAPIATITPSGPTSLCPGGSVTLTASSGSSYIWSNGATTQSITVNASGGYQVTVKNANFCSATSPLTTVTANPNPTVYIAAGGPTTFCAGGSLTLTASSGSSYLWSNGATTQVISATTGGNYSVTVTDANGCSSATSTPLSVTVNPNPAATITAGGPATFCAGGSVTLTASSGSSYFWSNGATTQSISASTSGSYSVIVNQATSCSSTSAATTVTVNPTPTATITAGGPTTFCAGGSVTLTASSGSSYLWSNGATTQSISANATGSYSVTVTDANGCSATSAPTAVTVNANPAPAITPGGPTTFCTGGSVTLTAPAGFTYTWSTSATTQSIVVSSSGSYSVTVHDGNGCSGTSSPVVVTVRSKSTAVVSGTASICQGSSTTITATLTGTAPWSVTWSDGVVQPVSSGTTATRSVSPSSTTTYTVTALADATCNGGTASGSAVVTVKPLPTANVTGGGTICPGASATITATLTGTAPYSVTWSDGVVQPVSSGTTATRSVSPAATTTYTVTSVSDAKSCPHAGTGSAIVTVKAIPTAVVSGGGTICPSGSATITAALTGTAPWSVTWSDGVVQPVSSGTTATRSVSPGATTTYTVTSVSDAASCPHAGTGSALVTRNTAASITTQPTNKTTTRNTNVTLSVVAAGTTPVSYQWFTGSGTAISAATSSSYTTSFPSKGTNTFYVEVWNACNGTHVKSTTVTVTVN